jgi:hypothetical protein
LRSDLQIVLNKRNLPVKADHDFMKIYLFIVLLLAAQTAGAQIQNPHPPESQGNLAKSATDNRAQCHIIKVQADEVSHLMLAGEYDKMYELIHPKVRKITGDKKAFIKFLGNGIAGLAATGFKIISVENFDPEEIVTAGVQSFAIVPTRLRIQTPQGILVQSAYEVAVSDDSGKKWLFVGGSHGKEELQKLFPAIIGKLTFPESILPVIEN